MRWHFSPLRLLFAALISALAAPNGFAQEPPAFSGRIAGVPDGDVVVAVDNRGAERRVRLEGIDAPEKGQEYGEAARSFLSGLVLDQTVTVVGKRFEGDGTLVAQVFLLGRDIGYSMIWAGLAWHDQAASSGQGKEERTRYAAAEKFARGTKENIWSVPKPVAPWAFRKQNPQAKDERGDTAALGEQGGQPALQQGAATITISSEAEVIGDKRSKIYYPDAGCGGPKRTGEKDRVTFASKDEAEAAGYKPARNCR